MRSSFETQQGLKERLEVWSHMALFHKVEWGLWGWCLGTGPVLQIGGNSSLRHCHRTVFRNGADKEMLKWAAPERSRSWWRLFEHVRSNGTWGAAVGGWDCWAQLLTEAFIAERSSCGECKQGTLGSHGLEHPQMKKLPWEAAILSIILWKL